jgi:hypothetical protein
MSMNENLEDIERAESVAHERALDQAREDIRSARGALATPEKASAYALIAIAEMLLGAGEEREAQKRQR